MVDAVESTSTTSEPVGANPAPSDSGGSVVDKRSGRGKIKYGELDPSDNSATSNRLSPVRWPLGEEPYHGTPGTEGSIGAQHKDASEISDSEWVNVKLEYVGLPPEPNQKHLLKLGAEIRMPCQVCGGTMFVAAAKSARAVLEEGGYTFSKDKPYNGLEKRVVVTACAAGHTAQFNEDTIKRLVKH